MYINNVELNIDFLSLSSKAVAVFNNLVMHCSNDTFSCFPGLKTIAKECRISVRSVQRGLDELLEAGYITKKHNYRANRSQTTNIYTVILKVAERVDIAAQNAKAKFEELRKRMVAKKDSAKQVKMELESLKVAKKSENLPKDIISKVLKALNFTNLARGASHTDHPIT